MFLQTTYFTNGKAIDRWINLNQVASMGHAEGEKLTKGFNTVMFMSNGYAMYSTLTPQEILELTGDAV